MKLLLLLVLIAFVAADPKMDIDLTSDNVPGVGSHVVAVYGGFVVTWLTNRDANDKQFIYLQGYNEDGIRMGDSVVICEIITHSTIPEIAGGLFSNRFMVAFVFDNEIFRVDGLLFEYGIELISAPCPAGTDIPRPVHYTMRVSSTSDASFFVLASSRYEGTKTTGIFLRIYDGEDIFSDPTPIHVSTHLLMSQNNPDVTILDDLTIVVVWQDVQSHGIYMMRYSRQGFPLSRAMRVTRMVSEANAPTVTSLSTGYVVGWKDKTVQWYPIVGGFKLTIMQSFIQVFSNDGTAIGEPFLVAENGAYKGNSMSVIACEDDTVWAAFAANGRVHAKHFDLSGNEVQEEVIIHGHVTLSHQHLRVGLTNYRETGLIITFGSGLEMPIATYWWSGKDNTPVFNPYHVSGGNSLDLFNNSRFNFTDAQVPLAPWAAEDNTANTA